MIADSLKDDRRLRLADDLPLRLRGRRAPRRRRPRPVRRRDPRLRGADRRRDHRLGRSSTARRVLAERRPSRSAIGPDPGHAVRARGDDRRPAPRRRRRSSARSTSGGWARRRTSARTSSSSSSCSPARRRSPSRTPRPTARSRVRAEHDALTGLRNHGALPARAGRRRSRPPSGAPFARPDDGPRRVQGLQRHLRPPGRRRAPGRGRRGDRAARPRRRTRSTATAATSSRSSCPGATRIEARRGRRADPPRRRGAAASPTGPRVAISAGVACYPEDGRTKDELVTAADQALYLVKPSTRSDEPRPARDPYLSALDETAIALMNRRDPRTCSRRSSPGPRRLLGTPHGYIYLVDPTASGPRRP